MKFLTMFLVGILLLPLFPTPSKATTLPQGMQIFRYGLYYSFAESLWINRRRKNYGGEGKTVFQTHTLTHTYGLLENLQIDSEIAYSRTKMSKGTEGGSSEGDSKSQISAISVGATYELWKNNWYSLDGVFSIKHPWYVGPSSDYDKSPDTFISPNDGSIHYNLGVKNNFYFSKKVSLQTLLKFIFRSGEPKDQLSLDLYLPIYLTQKLQVGPGFNYLRTFGGPDIGTAAFTSQVGLRGAGNTGRVRAFSVVNEEVYGLSFFFAYHFSQKWTVDAFVNKQIDGRNTDIATSTGVGLSFLM